MSAKFGSAIAGAAIAMLLCWPQPALAEAAKLYRYRNDQGVLVIDHTVPASAAGRGYEILSPDGEVLEKVEPAGTDTARETAAGPAGPAAKAIAEQEKIDRYLLTSYSSVADIEAVKARRIADLEREVGIARSRLEELARKRVAVAERAANLQRSGKPVPEALLQELAEVERQAATAGAQLEERQLQRQELADHYDAYIARFRELRGAAEQPQAAAAPQPAAATAPASAR
jgi:hypothetical protein